jgi:hypothetical protein
MESKGNPQGKNELKARFIELRATGLSIRAIAKDLQLSPQTLSNWQAELEEEIARLKAIELEALYEEYHLLKTHRLRKLGTQLGILEEEISRRSFSDVSTEKLLELQIKYFDELRKEYVEPQHLSGGQISDLRSKTGTKLDSEEISAEIHQVLLRYRAGFLDALRANRELNLLQAMLKAEDQVVLAAKLERLEALLGKGK